MLDGPDDRVAPTAGCALPESAVLNKPRSAPALIAEPDGGASVSLNRRWDTPRPVPGLSPSPGGA